MRKEIMYCDRCGKECERDRINFGFHIFRKNYFIRTVGTNEYLDLCQDCYDSLNKWMGKAKEDGSNYN